MLGIVRRLSDDNAQLKAQLAESRNAQTELQRRMSDARARVEAALSRLPLAVDDQA